MKAEEKKNDDASNAERDRRALDYLPLVRYVVGRLCIDLPASIDRDDLYSYGVLGLLHAATTYDPSRGVAFKTHAFIHIRGSILDELRKLDFLPRTRRDKVKKLDAAVARLQQSLGRAPSPEELAKELGVEEGDIDELLLVARTSNLLSIEDPGRSVPLGIACSKSEDPLDAAQQKEMKKALADAIGQLPEIEKKVIVLYYSEGLLLKEIGEVLGVTESRISQVHSRALFRLNRVLSPSLEGRK